MKIYYDCLISKPLGLLIVVSIIFFNCSKKNKDTSNLMYFKKDKIQKESDSIKISVNFSNKDLIILNIIGKKFITYPLSFPNKNSNDTIIIRKIPRNHNSQIIKYGYGSLSKKGGVNQHFLIEKNISEINFKLGDDKILKPNHNIIIDEKFFKDYFDFWLKASKSNKNDRKKLTSQLVNIKEFYNKKFSKNEELLKINELQYMFCLEYIIPNNTEVESYVQNIDLSLVGSPLLGLMKNYVENRIHTIDFNKLNSTNYSANYLKFMSIGIYRFLRIQKNKGDIQYKNAKKWLDTRSFYKSNQLAIDKEVAIIDNDKFKSYLNDIELLDTNLNKLSMHDIIKDKTSKYYVLDFWATWCAPCIDGIRKIKKMNLPKNIELLNISVDKRKDLSIWKDKTKLLHINSSFWIDNQVTKNQKFLKSIELKSLPRYMIIDKDFNIIDYAFLTPSDSKFILKLKKLD